MSLIDFASWKIVQIIALAQTIILVNILKFLQNNPGIRINFMDESQLAGWIMSGWVISHSQPQDLPEYATRMLLRQGYIFLVIALSVFLTGLLKIIVLGE